MRQCAHRRACATRSTLISVVSCVCSPWSPNVPTVAAHRAAGHFVQQEHNFARQRVFMHRAQNAHDAVLSPDAAPPLGRQNLRTCGRRRSGRAVAKKKKSREARGASSRPRGKIPTDHAWVLEMRAFGPVRASSKEGSSLSWLKMSPSITAGLGNLQIIWSWRRRDGYNWVIATTVRVRSDRERAGCQIFEGELNPTTAPPKRSRAVPRPFVGPWVGRT